MDCIFNIRNFLHSGLVRKMVVIIIALVVCMGKVSAQTEIDSLTIFFRQGIGTYDPNFKQNRQQMDAFAKRMSTLLGDKNYRFMKISYVYTASTSPEGSYTRNVSLAKERAASISNLLHKHLNFGDKEKELNLFSENYEELRALVADSYMPYRAEVLHILDNYSTQTTKSENGNYINPCKSALMALHNGEAWRYMEKNLFPLLRHFSIKVVFEDDLAYIQPAVERQMLVSEEETPMLVTYFADPNVEYLEFIDVADEKLAQIQFEQLPHVATIEQTAAIQVAEMINVPQISIKTNGIGWAMGISNLALEIDLAKRFSFNLPVYYSGINYFAETTKFRIFGVYPEFRYWFTDNDGLFIGAHAGFAYFNFALGKNSAYRYQDAGGTKPAMGGGLNVGYRMPLSKKHPRWKVEFSLGAGVYDVNYDKFINEKGGLKVQGTFHKTAIAVDNVGVSFSYSFDIKKRNR